MVLYDSIGNGYSSTRRADPFITDSLFELLSLSAGAHCLDVGCGTGNYLQAMVQKGLRLTGIDPSELMLNEARNKQTGAELLNASAESLPFPSGTFDGAIAVLTFHHWKNLQQGLTEIHRVIKPGAKLAAFSFSPEQMRGYWLCHYFPGMMQRSMQIIPEKKEMEQLLRASGFKSIEFINYFVRPDLCDHFLYSHKDSPEKYLDPEIRKNTSAFSAFANAEEVEKGITLLAKDIETGFVNSIIQRYENNNGHYLFIKAVK